MPDTIKDHEGKKYLRWVQSPDGTDIIVDPKNEFIKFQVDIYSVLEAYKVTCQPTGHAIKKLLCAGSRGKGDRLADLVGAKAAIQRAIELEKSRVQDREQEEKKEVISELEKRGGVVPTESDLEEIRKKFEYSPPKWEHHKWDKPIPDPTIEEWGHSMGTTVLADADEVKSSPPTWQQMTSPGVVPDFGTMSVPVVGQPGRTPIFRPVFKKVEPKSIPNDYNIQDAVKKKTVSRTQFMKEFGFSPKVGHVYQSWDSVDPESGTHEWWKVIHINDLTEPFQCIDLESCPAPTHGESGLAEGEGVKANPTEVIKSSSSNLEEVSVLKENVMSLGDYSGSIGSVVGVKDQFGMVHQTVLTRSWDHSGKYAFVKLNRGFQ